jgi:hypothetical protein
VALGDPALTCVAQMFASAAELADGDPLASLRRARAAYELSADVAPALHWAMRAQLMRYTAATEPPAVAKAENDAWFAMAEAGEAPDRFNWWASAAMGVHMVEHYRVGELAEMAAEYAVRFPGARSWWAGTALALADAGRLDEAREVVRREHLTPEAVMQEPFPHFGRRAGPHGAALRRP